MCRTVDFYGPWRSYLEIAAEKIKKSVSRECRRLAGHAKTDGFGHDIRL